MANDITLSSATRTNLLSLQRTTSLIGSTQERLSSGLKVNSALDDALSFFKARNLNNRASDLSTVKDGISEGISVITAAVQGLESMEATLKQMKAIASSARAASDSTSRQKLASQFNELRSQVDALAEDASFNGINLITGETTRGPDTLTVKFNEKTGSSASNTLVVNGQNMSIGVNSSGSAGQLSFIGSAMTSGTTSASWADSTNYVANIDGFIDNIDSALTIVRDTAQQFGTNASMLEIRREFTDNLINTLKSGAGDLVNADMNEESANMLSLQTRQQLGTISLSIAQQSEQSVLRLF
ncbi:flagellin [Roseospirillum parvum]|uniref:Flagellin n=1 Tax=Roseospirillum parvum TaxID=83401 RepID=A0A1G8BPL8_9PROT|nr:flagellin [Roseospirillum parvum]SDH35167.1 Flagellin FlgL [Roseospirillum parvum]